jgi:hypothetical protein
MLVHEIFSAYFPVVDCKVIPPKMEGQKAAALVRFQSVDEASWLVENLNGNIAEGLTDPVVVRFSASTAAASSGGAFKGSSGGDAPTAPWQSGKAPSRYEPYASTSKGGGKLDQTQKGFGKGFGKPTCNFQALIAAVRKSGLLGDMNRPEENSLYVKNLPPDTTDLDLYCLFAPFGAIASGGVKVMTNEDGSSKGYGFVDYLDPAVTQAAAMTMDGFTMPGGAQLGCNPKRARAAKGKGKDWMGK